MSNAIDILLTAENIEPCKFCDSLAIDDDGYCAECGLLRLGSETVNIEPVALPAGVILARLIVPDKNAGEGLARAIDLPEGVYVVGRVDADLVVNDPFVSRVHAEVRVSNDGIEVTDKGSTNGTFVSNNRLHANAPQTLAIGDALRFGQTDVKWEFLGLATDTEATTSIETSDSEKESAKDVDCADASDVSTSDYAELPSDTTCAENVEPETLAVEIAPSKWTLKCVNRDLPEFTLNFGSSVIGRKAGKADIVVTGDGFISSAHVCIEIDGDEEDVYITDLSSTNGTYVEDWQIEPMLAVKLEKGAHIRIGETEFELTTMD